MCDYGLEDLMFTTLMTMQTQTCTFLRRSRVARVTKVNHKAVPFHKNCIRHRSSALAVEASFKPTGRLPMGNDITTRVFSALPYILPYVNAISYGTYLFRAWPALARHAVLPFAPIAALYEAVPFGSTLAFFGLYIGVVKNRSLSRFIRFNALQALLLDILLALPRLLEAVFSPPTSGDGLYYYAMGQSGIWMATVALILYAVINALLGRWAYLPFIGDAAREQASSD